MKETVDLKNNDFVFDENQSYKKLSHDAYSYWQKKYISAQNNMEERKGKSGVLIEVASQHPLVNGCEPNNEFCARLDKAIEIYNSYKQKGIPVFIMVPGSKHMFGGVCDEISLSEAGCNYLLKRGIPKEAVFGDEINKKYKGDDGVYNSADECYVVSKLFADGDYFKLICVCSPNQIMRKTLFYIEFGWIPTCYAVPTENMFHENVIDELFYGVNRVLYEDHNWQGKDSEFFKVSRAERKP